MAVIPLATQGNYLHIYEFRVKPGKTEEFVKQFNEFDYSDDNPMHKSPAQVRDGVLVQDVKDSHRFWLIAEWSDIEEHARIRKKLATMDQPALAHVEGGWPAPDYGLVVSSTPQAILDKATK